MLATDASTALLIATLDPGRTRDERMAAVDQILDTYLGYSPGCTQYKDSKGLFGCTTVGAQQGPGALAAWSSIGLLAQADRRRRQRTSAFVARGLVIAAAFAVAAGSAPAQSAASRPPTPSLEPTATNTTSTAPAKAATGTTVATPATTATAVRSARTLKALLGLSRYLDFSLGVGFVGLPNLSDSASPMFGMASMLGAGLRLKRPHDRRSLHGASPWVDAEALSVQTGAGGRRALAVGAGLALPIGHERSIWMGPFVRYVQVIEPNGAGSGNRASDGLFAGITFEVGSSAWTADARGAAR